MSTPPRRQPALRHCRIPSWPSWPACSRSVWRRRVAVGPVRRPTSHGTSGRVSRGSPALPVRPPARPRTGVQRGRALASSVELRPRAAHRGPSGPAAAPGRTALAHDRAPTSSRQRRAPHVLPAARTRGGLPGVAPGTDGRPALRSNARRRRLGQPRLRRRVRRHRPRAGVGAPRSSSTTRGAAGPAPRARPDAVSVADGVLRLELDAGPRGHRACAQPPTGTGGRSALPLPRSTATSRPSTPPTSCTASPRPGCGSRAASASTPPSGCSRADCSSTAPPRGAPRSTSWSGTAPVVGQRA